MLLVDNYDSYTYNLYQLIAEVIGVAPVLLHNDAPDWSELDLDSFDGIVISPGPGHPGRERDFGRCAQLIEEAPLPLLGVCLGYQGIGLAAGASVMAAPEPRHGHLSRIRHDTDGLFAGIPQGFIGVRYHSLCLREPLPEALTATAWAEDGVVMAVRHRDRPQWGVQFHPESVASEHGARLMANFRDLARAARPVRAGRSVAAQPRTLRSAAQPVGSAVPFRVEHRSIEPGDGTTPDAARIFAALYADSSQAFWLDSSRVEAGRARFSFLGDSQGPHSETLTYRVGVGAVRVTLPDGSTHYENGTVFDVLAERLRSLVVDAVDLPFGFVGGWVGYFGYELKADCGATRAATSATPDAVWTFADRLVVVDHQTGRVHLVVLMRDDDEDTAAWLHRAECAVRDNVGHGAGLPAVSRDEVDLEAHLLRDRVGYSRDIAACQSLLRAGESYEICLTNAVQLAAPRDPFAFYLLMRRDNPAPYGAYLRHNSLVVAGSSPESFLQIAADRRVRTKPIKGTAPRHEDPADDAREVRELLESPKVRAENLMIVDLMRNDLGRVCEIGSVTVSEYLAVESYATLHQLVSTVEGVLRRDVTAIDCVRACFPGGSMTGAPKLRTMELLDSLEGRARGVYSGALGYFAADGSAELSIVIRTAVIDAAEMTIGAGGAIVLASDPAAEFEEMLLKAAAPLGLRR